ncbi:aldehyde dehydrogenase family protein [Streptomyces sp. NPDC051985]|uniref:aldehyde dehydrogenase family protein n=1 Tax=Streptomyces sp. NPDC051985 TaxID=3155807 RepID=UPI00344679B9
MVFRDLSGERLQLIDGETVLGEGPVIEVINPATEELLLSVPEASPGQLDRAVRSARRAFDSGEWPAMSAEQRARLLEHVWRTLMAHEDELLDSLIAETGAAVSSAKPVQFGEAMSFLRWFADAARRVPVVKTPPDFVLTQTAGEVRAVPVGVVAAIAAFNYPLLIAMLKVGAALAAGCTTVLMPSPRTPVTTLMLGRLLNDCGLPPGVVNVLVGEAGIAKALTEHPLVDKISFTGSDHVGALVAEQAGRNIKGVVLELGGKSPCVVMPGGTAGPAVDTALRRLFRNAGQGCKSPSRILVHEDEYDTAVAQARKTVGEITVGDPLDPATDVGPVIRAAERDRIAGVVADAVANGAEVLASAALPDLGKGFWSPPTVIGGVTNADSISQNEIFGPVAVLLPYRDVDEAVAIANDTRFGLAGYVYGPDTPAALEVAQRIRAGSVFVNGGVDRPDTPGGGFKASGIGREGGDYGISEFYQWQNLRWAL